MSTSQARFKWTNGKSINLIKCLQELDSLYVKFSFLNIDSFQWLQGFKELQKRITNFNFLLTAAIFVLIFFDTLLD